MPQAQLSPTAQRVGLLYRQHRRRHHNYQAARFGHIFAYAETAQLRAKPHDHRPQGLPSIAAISLSDISIKLL